MENLLKNKKVQLSIIIIITLILLLLPHIIRYMHYGKIILPGDKLYYDLRIAQDITLNKLKANDQLVATQNTYYFNFYYYFLAAFLLFFNPEITVLLLTILLAILSIILLFKILKAVEASEEVTLLSLIFFMISPIFITENIILGQSSLALVIMFSFFYLYLQSLNNHNASKSIFKNITSNYIQYIAMLLLLIVLITTSILFTYFLLILLFVIQMIYRKMNYWLLLIAAIIIIITVILGLSHMGRLPQQITPTNIFEENVSDLGAMLGFGVFQLMLLFLGFFKLSSKKNYKLLLFGTIVLLMLGRYYPDLKYIGNIFIALIAALTCIQLLQQQWKLTLIKDITIFLIILGILFSALATITKISIDHPTAEEQTALLFLKEYAKTNQDGDQNGILLTAANLGHFIEYTTKSGVLLDSTSYLEQQSSDYNLKMDQMKLLFNSRDIKQTIPLLEKLNIKYIFITNEMKTKTIWKKQDQGLLFLLQNSERFKKVYESKDTELWAFLPLTSEEKK